MSSYIVRCSRCGTKNRIPEDKAGRTASCGKCGEAVKTDVLLTDKPVTVTDAAFQNIVLKAQLPMLLDCWAPWCGPCRIVGPVLDQLAKEWKGRALVGKLNVDENQQTAGAYRIESIPALLIFDNGEKKAQLVGAAPRREIIEKMRPFL